ncbi:MAG: GlxA family transcriptional regulator [Pseudomonadota bacterium]
MLNTTKNMQKWRNPPQGKQTVVVLLFERFSNHCLANAVEPLRATNELLGREAYAWDFVTLDGKGVASSSGLPVQPAARLADHPGGDVLFVMSSYDTPRLATPAATRALKSATRRFTTVAGLDTGSWLMAASDLLEGRRATIHWNDFVAFSEAFPNVDAVPDRVVFDGRWITCGGAMTAFDMVREMIRRTHGEAIRLEVEAFFLHPTAERPRHLTMNVQGPGLVYDALAAMSDAIEDPLPIEVIAKRAGTTPRTLTRAFNAQLGAPPQTVYKRLRLMAARRHAEQSDYSITEIALRCGYEDPAAMTRAFKAEFGQTPSSYRRTS